MTAITSSERAATGAGGESAELDLVGAVDVFDRDRVHEIAIEFAQRDYRRMLDVFSATGDKQFIESTVTIDGTRIEDAGIRLKGNSTLRRLGGGFGGFGGFGGGGDISSNKPEALPWLVEFDAFVENRRYQGYETLAIRPTGNVSSTALNEALATALVAAAGEPAVRFSYASVTINGGEPTLRLVLEEPDRRFAEDTLLTDGVLYKSLSTGRFEYLGEDAVAYAELLPPDHAQEAAGPAAGDRPPALDDGSHRRGVRRRARRARRRRVLRAVRRAPEPAAQLRRHGRAWPELLPLVRPRQRPVQRRHVGSQLRALGDASQSPFDQGRFGSGRFGGGRPPMFGGGGASDFGGRPPNGAPAPDFGGGMRPRGGNLFKERFLASDAFHDLYLAEYRKLYETLYASGRALQELDRLEQVLASSDAIDHAAMESEVSALRAMVESRRDGRGRLRSLAPERYAEMPPA